MEEGCRIVNGKVGAGTSVQRYKRGAALLFVGYLCRVVKVMYLNTEYVAFRFTLLLPFQLFSHSSQSD